MYKDYTSPLISYNANQISKTLSRIVGTLVDYNAHETVVGRYRSFSADWPIRILPFERVNGGYEILIDPEHVRVCATHTHVTEGMSETLEYAITIPRVKRDVRHYQLRKLEYTEVLTSLLVKSYGARVNPVLYSSATVKDATTECRAVSVVNVMVDLLKEGTPFSLIFHRNHWKIRWADGSRTWYPKGVALRTGRPVVKKKAAA
jgi:hypothetical protein